MAACLSAMKSPRLGGRGTPPSLATAVLNDSNPNCRASAGEATVVAGSAAGGAVWAIPVGAYSTRIHTAVAAISSQRIEERFARVVFIQYLVFSAESRADDPRQRRPSSVRSEEHTSVL